jgi:hypothetical protein
VTDSEALGRSRLVSVGVQEPSIVTEMTPATSGLLQLNVKGYLAAPAGLAKNLGALVITGLEQLIVGDDGSTPGLNELPCTTSGFVPTDRMTMVKRIVCAFFMEPSWDRPCRSNQY